MWKPSHSKLIPFIVYLFTDNVNNTDQSVAGMDDSKYELEMISREVVLAYFRVLSWHFPE